MKESTEATRRKNNDVPFFPFFPSVYWLERGVRPVTDAIIVDPYVGAHKMYYGSQGVERAKRMSIENAAVMTSSGGLRGVDAAPAMQDSFDEFREGANDAAPAVAGTSFAGPAAGIGGAAVRTAGKLDNAAQTARKVARKQNDATTAATGTVRKLHDREG